MAQSALQNDIAYTGWRHEALFIYQNLLYPESRYTVAYLDQLTTREQRSLFNLWVKLPLYSCTTCSVSSCTCPNTQRQRPCSRWYCPSLDKCIAKDTLHKPTCLFAGLFSTLGYLFNVEYQARKQRSLILGSV